MSIARISAWSATLMPMVMMVGSCQVAVEGEEGKSDVTMACT
jgi:hypothetical protein